MRRLYPVLLVTLAALSLTQALHLMHIARNSSLRIQDVSDRVAEATEAARAAGIHARDAAAAAEEAANAARLAARRAATADDLEGRVADLEDHIW